MKLHKFNNPLHLILENVKYNLDWIGKCTNKQPTFDLCNYCLKKNYCERRMEKRNMQVIKEEDLNEKYIVSKNKIDVHFEICRKLNDTYKRKNQDYGDSFGKSFKKRGIAAAMVRMEDKWNRLDNLTLHPENIQVKDESIKDTLLDLANYCIMTYMELNEEQNN